MIIAVVAAIVLVLASIDMVRCLLSVVWILHLKYSCIKTGMVVFVPQPVFAGRDNMRGSFSVSPLHDRVVSVRGD